MEELSVLEEIEQKLDLMTQAEKVHVIGDLACEMYAQLDIEASEEAEEIGERIRYEGDNTKIEDAIATLKKLIDSL